MRKLDCNDHWMGHGVMNKKSTISMVILFFMVLGLLATAQPSHSVTLEEEIKIGQDIDKQILEQIPLSSDKEAIAEMDRLGQQLVQGVRRTEIKYYFRILDEGDELDAFSIPGGYIYFSQRMWDILRPDERVGVLAHEISHVDGRHALDAISKQRKRMIITNVLLILVGANGTWADVAGLANSLYSLKYSRGDEALADREAVELAEKANMNPAGILLAMRKIMRFQDEVGGQPPKIFSTHPPSKERIEKLSQLLQSKGIPVPEENVQTVDNPYRIGQITAVSGNSVQFSSTQPLENGDIVWVMVPGWDYRYENRTFVPAARGVVQKAGITNTALLWQMSTTRDIKFKAGMDIFAPPTPDPVDGVGMIEYVGKGSNDIGRLVSESPIKKLERFFAVQTVWDNIGQKIVWDNVGYVVITNPETRGYVSVSISEYSYAPISADSILISVNDSNADHWVGPIVSIGRGGQTIEVLPNKQLDKETVYDVLYPAWDSKDSYEDRLVGKARLHSVGNKIVLKMTSYTLGWDINRIENGFDIYEESGYKILE